MLHVHFAAVEDAVSFLEGADGFRGEAGAFESYLVDPAHFGRVAVGDEERGDVLHDFRASAGDGMASDAAELVDRGESADHGMVADLHVSGQGAVVGEDDAIADDAVVRDVRVGEKVSPAADDRFRAGQGAAVHRAEFAEGVAVADFEKGRLAFVFEVLRFLSDRRVSEKEIAAADRCRAHHRDVVLEFGVFADDDVRPDHAVGPDAGAGGDFRRGIDDGGRVDHSETRPKRRLPSLTISPLTVQEQAARAMVLRERVSSQWMNSVSPGKTGLRNFTSSALMK